jgi:hypothetical protein
MRTDDGDARPLTIATLGDMIDADYWLLIVCDRGTPPCNTAPVDVSWLAGRVGRGIFMHGAGSATDRLALLEMQLSAGDVQKFESANGTETSG